MKQIIQSFSTGETLLEEVPVPKVRKGNVLIQTSRSLVSLGTERMLVEFGKSNIIQKARQQPDKVKQVLDKIRTDGLLPTLETIFNKLGEPLPLGYCNVGTIVAVGDNVEDFKIGDRVASNGHHAEYVSVPKNLVAHIPENVSNDDAAFTIIGSIGLQGIRLLNPTFGETVVVIGMGLIGLITSQILIASGCKVIGSDIDSEKLKMAEGWGVIPFNPTKGNLVKFIQEQTNGAGADGVIITASSKSNDIITQAAQMSRKRGRIILVGVIGLDISRADFYEKELIFQVSCSYGPGRYDEDYEQKGIDYPLPFVRWTEKRNFEAVLQAISSGSLKVKDLITEVVELKDYLKIYGNIAQTRSIASLLKYDDKKNIHPTRNIQLIETRYKPNESVIGLIGAGNFTKSTLLPSLRNSGAKIKYIASSSGLSGTTIAKKYKIANSTTDYNIVLNDPDVNLIIITTRHNLHASLVVESLEAGKNVFVEKPLALNHDELSRIMEVQQNSGKQVMVGFNRRFSPHIQKIKYLTGGGTTMNVVATMNAGYIPESEWVHDMKIGGGRIIGEACHYIDLITYLTESKVNAVCMNAMGINPEENTDNATILLKYENGSTGVINYFANGSKKYSKERLEIFSQEKTYIMDNFRKTRGFGVKGFSKMTTKLNKGHKKQFELLVNNIRNGGEALIPFDEIINTTLASFAAIDSLKRGEWILI